MSSVRAHQELFLLSQQGEGSGGCPSFLGVWVDLLEVGRDGLHDLIGLGPVIDGMRVEVARRAQLQLGHSRLFILLDCDLIGLREVRLFPSHHLDEFFQVFDFFGLYEKVG